MYALRNSLALLLGFSAAAAQTTTPIAAPPSEKLAVQAQGVGVQIYGCTQSGTAYSWILKAPEAKLVDDGGKTIGRHFAGPTWRLDDGSEVKGKVQASQPAAGAIPWLKLLAVSTGGEGRLSQVDMVLRTDTKGGVAPTSGCDAMHANAEVRVDYSATYRFFRSN